MILTIIIASLMMWFLTAITPYALEWPEILAEVVISIAVGIFITVLVSAGYGAYDEHYETYSQQNLYSLNKVDDANYLIISTEDKTTKYYLDVQKEPIHQSLVLRSSDIKDVENCTDGQPVLILNKYRYENKFMNWFIFDLGKSDDYTIVIDKKLITTR